MTNVVKTEHH